MIEFEFDDGGLEEVQKRLEALPEEQAVSFADAFPPDFMAQYTSFADVQAFIDAAEVDADCPDKFQDIPPAILDDFVAAKTRFADWKDMQAKASEEYISRQIGLSD